MDENTLDSKYGLVYMSSLDMICVKNTTPLMAQ